VAASPAPRTAPSPFAMTPLSGQLAESPAPQSAFSPFAMTPLSGQLAASPAPQSAFSPFAMTPLSGQLAASQDMLQPGELPPETLASAALSQFSSAPPFSQFPSINPFFGSGLAPVPAEFVPAPAEEAERGAPGESDPPATASHAAGPVLVESQVFEPQRVWSWRIGYTSGMGYDLYIPGYTADINSLDFDMEGRTFKLSFNRQADAAHLHLRHRDAVLHELVRCAQLYLVSRCAFRRRGTWS